MEKIYLGGGCFWCVEAVFNQVRGVQSALSGYMGGARPNPSYEQVCTGVSGHAEVVEVSFDPSQIELSQLLKIFFAIHDPTTLNRQGNDVGTQYRSAIFYTNEAQADIVRSVIAELVAEAWWTAPITTEVAAAPTFWVAEDYHQNYLVRNPQQGYCLAVVAPKVAKFRRTFSQFLKNSDSGRQSFN
ncbi:peptide-methionine (S)-S-oxide reductase MsrA [Parvibium lacunae]|uniref:Peptide methionine sulfoxide reductase MsrA n=1 Tax=Parvibium lacunae TaxID=1888893 RepID=A0A368KYF9_9BURK|nr:peptide-methionine (S)-S-oxide reductase MsrA [Parvibium lacunae]RCS56476.1 peptide-methionine (S)-S-oxide reductase [Parvibium lacunae]